VTSGGWRARWLWIVGAPVVMGAVGVLVWWTFGSGGESTATQRLAAGDCVRERAAQRLLPQVVEKTRCDRPHYGEVFAVLTAPESDEYPGAEALTKVGDDCGRQLWGYAPDLPDGPIFEIAIGIPTVEEWTDGQRSVVCVAQSDTEQWASMRG